MNPACGWEERLSGEGQELALAYFREEPPSCQELFYFRKTQASQTTPSGIYWSGGAPGRTDAESRRRLGAAIGIHAERKPAQARARRRKLRARLCAKVGRRRRAVGLGRVAP